MYTDVMSNHTEDIAVGDIVKIAKGRYAGHTGQVIQRTARQLFVSGAWWVNVSSISTESIRMARRVRRMNEIRAEYPAAAGILTWEWLRRDLSEAEADAWLGLDESIPA